MGERLSKMLQFYAPETSKDMKCLPFRHYHPGSENNRAKPDSISSPYLDLLGVPQGEKHWS